MQHALYNRTISFKTTQVVLLRRRLQTNSLNQTVIPGPVTDVSKTVICCESSFDWID